MVDADLTLVVIDLSVPAGEEDRALIARAQGQGRSIVVGNKCDLPRPQLMENTGTDDPRLHAEACATCPTSALTGEGIDALREAIFRAVAPANGVEQEAGFITSLRHARLLRESLEYLKKARGAVALKIPHEMLLLDLYGALRPIDAITGATTADDILNRIFSTFCIGK